MSAMITLLATASDSILQGAGAACQGSCNTSTSVTGLFGTISNILIYLVGAISVIMIILAGFKYVTSGGDPKAVSSAKDNILYSVIGIVVALVAYAIVHFVVLHIK